MLLPQNLVRTGAGRRAAGSEVEGRVGHRGGSTAKVAEAGH